MSGRRRTRLPDLGSPRFEVIPLPGIRERVLEQAPSDAVVTVTASPRQGIAATVECAARLAAAGWPAVPHLSARMIADDAELAGLMGTLASSGVTEVFVVGGDAPQPAGAFDSGLELLQAMERIGHDFRIGVPGYPEGHLLFSAEVATQALLQKSRYASYVVSQMCFDAPGLLDWASALRQHGISLPITVGVPGPATAARLLKVGTKIGVGESMRVLAQHRGGLLRLLKPTPWKPDRLLRALAPGFADPAVGLSGLHIYTFNDVAGAVQWWNRLPQHR